MLSLIRTRQAPRATFALAGCALVAYAVHHGFGLGGAALDVVFAPVLYAALMALVAVASLRRAAIPSVDRVPFIAAGVALVLWAASAAYAAAAPDSATLFAGLSPSELGFLACYAIATPGLLALLLRRARGLLGRLWFELVVVVLGVSSVWATLLLPGALNADGVPVLHAAVYPTINVLASAAILGFVLVGRRVTTWRWRAAVAICALATADGLFAGHVAGAEYARGILDLCWPLIVLLLALGSVRPDGGVSAHLSLRRTLGILGASGLAAVAILVVDHYDRLSWPAVLLAGLTLAAVVVRFTRILGRYHGALDEARHVHDALAAETAALRASEARVLDAHRIARLGTWEWDVERDEMRFSAQFAELLGADLPQAVPVSTCIALAHPDDRGPLLRALEQAASHGEGFELQVRAMGGDGAWRMCHIRASAERLPGGGRRVYGSTQDVSEEVRRRAALREAQERLHHAFEDAPIGKGIVAMDGRWLEANRALCELLGYSREELARHRIDELTHPDDAPADVPVLAEFCAGVRDAYQTEKRYIRADGEEVWAQVNVTCIRLGDGAADYLVTQVQDITARRRSEAQLRAAEQRFRLAFDEAPIGISLVDPAGRRLRVNRAYCEILGYAADELVGTPVDAITHPCDVAESRAIMARGLAGEPLPQREIRFIDKDGNIVWAHSRATLVRDDDGAPLYFVSQIVDVTQRKRTDAALKRLAAIVESSHDAIVATNRRGDLTSWNPAAERLYGYRAEAVIGRSIDILAPADSVEEARTLRALVLAGGPVEHYETCQRRADGTTMAVSLTKSPIRDDAGEIVGVSTITRDITDRIAARREIEQLLGDQRAILASAGEGIYRVGGDGRITFVNPSAAQMLGWEPAELLGRKAHETLHHSYADGTPFPFQECSLHLRLRDGEVARSTNERFFRRDGSSFPVDWTSAPIRDGGRVSGAVVVFRDMSVQLAAEEERGALQERLSQLERLDTVGKLASGIAHDFNNLIAVISTYAALLSDDVSDEQRGDVEQIRSAARSAAALTRQLLILGRRDIGRDEPVRLDGLIRATDALLRHTLGERTTLVTRLEAENSSVVADRTQLEQLVLNLVINARDAMPDGGTLRIDTANIDVAEDLVAGLEAGTYVRLSVRDSGHGMDEDVVAHAFDPFFTTKGPGQGSGLGLTTVFGIATKSGGTVELESEPGRGTTVSVFLPTSPCPADTPGGPAAAERPSISTLPFRNVVLVEDNDRVRAAATALLTRRGLHVAAVAHGAEALALLESGQEADVLLTDVVMPGLTGPQLAREVERIRPGLPTVFMTGYSDDAALTADSAICIGKPFGESELLDALERAVISAD
jgi:two-component system cell cycle sensor histidine kinase/response regulator CckA